MMDSVGDEELFFRKLGNILTINQKYFIVGEPQYTNRNEDEKVVDAVREWQMQNIKHSHVPTDYIQNTQMKDRIESIGYELYEKK